MEAKISTLAGVLTGGAAKLMTGDIGAAILTALVTGAAAYIGQHVAKYIHKKIKGL
jgi:hypothetical protein